jgi:hypothetical protein
MKLTRLLVLLTALLALIFAFPASAQLNTATSCGDLSEADCEILLSSEIAPSASFSGEGMLVVTVDGTPFEATLGMDGTYIADTDLAATYIAMQDMTPDEVLDMIYADPDTFVTFITDFFQLVDSEMTLSVSVPPMLTQGLPASYDVPLYLVDGAAYADLAAFSALDPSLTGVYGIDLVALYTDIFNQPETAEALDMMFQMSDEDMDGFAAFTDPEFLKDFVTIERLDDTNANGRDAAVFLTTVDYGALFASDALRGMIEDQLAVQQEMMAEADPEAAEAMEMFDGGEIMDLYATLFEGATLTQQITIGLEDGYTYATDISFNMDVDMSGVDSPLATEMGLAMVPPIVADFSFSITQSGFGDVAEITLPEGAQTLPQELFGM